MSLDISGAKWMKTMAKDFSVMGTGLLMSSNLETGCDELQLNGWRVSFTLKWQLTAAKRRTD